MLSKEEVLKIADLAHLTCEGEELEQLTKEFNAILEYVQQLEKVDVSDVEAMSHVHGSTNIFREDESKETLSTEEVLKNAPDSSGTFIKVPLVIEQGTES